MYETAVYQLRAPADGDPIWETAAQLRTTVDRIEAALIRGGVAPPAAQDLAALTGRVVALEQAVVDITSTTRPTSPAPNRRYRETDTSDVVSYVDGQWVKVGGPPRTLVSAAVVPATAGNAYPLGSLSTLANIAVPAHTAGLLQLVGSAGLYSAGVSASAVRWSYPATTQLSASTVRFHNNGAANVPVSVPLQGWTVSDGSAQTARIVGIAEATPFGVIGGFASVYLHALPR